MNLLANLSFNLGYQATVARRHGVLRARSVAQTMASIVLGMPFSKMCGIAASWAVLLAVGGDYATF